MTDGNNLVLTIWYELNGKFRQVNQENIFFNHLSNVLKILGYIARLKRRSAKVKMSGLLNLNKLRLKLCQAQV